MIISAPHISGWISVLILSATVYALGRLLGDDLSPKARLWIVRGAVALLVALTIGSALTYAAIDYDPRAYCSWAWWDFIIC